MPEIAVDTLRDIVDDFAKEIAARMTIGPKPASYVLDFRNEKSNQRERPVVLVPLELLRYRRHNGRIASDIAAYERAHGPLNERDAAAQKVIEEFLWNKDPENTGVLIKSIGHSGQNEPAIITCDGFLINGNRRRMAFQKLREENPGRSEYQTMKVVILPGKGDDGGPPTKFEIEKLENKYQLQREGKSEYHGLDRALSYRRKIALGLSLEMQLRDNPMYANSDEKELQRAVKDIENDFLKPLECVDRYLETFGREMMYSAVTEGPAAKDGRWQAFIDYSGAYQKFQSDKWRQENDVPEEDVGAIEDAAFKLIRLRHLKDIGKVHAVMRQLPKLVALRDSRKELVKISVEVDATLPKRDQVDADGKPLAMAAVDRKWEAANTQTLLHRLKTAMKIKENQQETETPLTLLTAALAKLNHTELAISEIKAVDFDRARQLTVDIQRRAADLEKEIYRVKKELEALPKRK